MLRVKEIIEEFKLHIVVVFRERVSEKIIKSLKNIKAGKLKIASKNMV